MNTIVPDCVREGTLFPVLCLYATRGMFSAVLMADPFSLLMRYSAPLRNPARLHVFLRDRQRGKRLRWKPLAV